MVGGLCNYVCCSEHSLHRQVMQSLSSLTCEESSSLTCEESSLTCEESSLTCEESSSLTCEESGPHSLVRSRPHSLARILTLWLHKLSNALVKVPTIREGN